jgi:hypothetical protein
MTIGRLTGDRIVQWLGGSSVLVAGGICGALGFGVATLVPVWQVTLIGYALLGLGCSNIVPVLYSSVGRQTGSPWFIVSNDAVFDRDVHVGTPVGVPEDSARNAARTRTIVRGYWRPRVQCVRPISRTSRRWDAARPRRHLAVLHASGR